MSCLICASNSCLQQPCSNNACHFFGVCFNNQVQRNETVIFKQNGNTSFEIFFSNFHNSFDPIVIIPCDALFHGVVMTCPLVLNMW